MHLLNVAVGMLLVSAMSALAAPIAFGPMQVGDDGKVQFTFSEDMADAIDISWSGNGIDPSKISCDWVASPVPNIPFPQQILHCSYAGGFPVGIEIAWIVNPNNSSVMKSKAGEAVAMTSGSFNTPDPDPDPDPDPNPDPDPEAKLKVFASPMDGQALAPFQKMTFVFEQPMKDQIDITWDKGEWNCVWFTFPGTPRMQLQCSPTSVIDSGTYRWTLGPGFVSEAGEALETTTGTVLISDFGGGNGGGGDNGGVQIAPDCGGDHAVVPFPKRMSLCGGEVNSWNSAIVIPNMAGDRFGIIADSASSEGSRESLISLDSTGLTQWRVYAGESNINLNVGATENLVTAYGERDDGQLIIGAFDAVADLAPVYQVKTLATSNDVQMVGVPDGRTAVMQAFDGHVEVFVVGNDGQLDWGKTFSSPKFEGAPSSGVPGVGLTRVSRLTSGPDGFLIVVTQTETTIDGTSFHSSHDVTMVSVDDNGTMKWSKTYTGLGGTTAPIVVGSERSVYLSSFETDTSNPMSPRSAAMIYKLNGQGNVDWGRSFTNGILSYNAELPSGKTLLVGSLLQGSGVNTTFAAVMVLLNTNGAVERGLTFESPDQQTIVPAVFAGKNKVFLTLVGTDTEVEVPFTVGAADHQLNGFTWKSYPEPVTQGNVIPYLDQAQEGAVFSSFNEATRQLDTFKVADDLTAEGGCPTLDDASVTVSAINVPNASASLATSNATVSVSNLTPAFTDTTIAIQLVECDEVSLCADGGNGGGNGTNGSSELTIRKTGANSGALEFESESGKTYVLERSLTLEPAAWTEFQQLPGTGSKVSFPVTNDPRAAYFRLLLNP